MDWFPALLQALAMVVVALVSVGGTLLATRAQTRPTTQATLNASFQLLLDQFRHEVERVNALASQYKAESELNRAKWRSWEVWGESMERTYDRLAAIVTESLPDVMLPAKPARPHQNGTT